MKTLAKIIRKIPAVKVMVIGDLVLDEYVWGHVERISPEAPVPVVWGQKRTYVPGGAANVAYNIRSLGAEVCLVGVVGRDKNRETLCSELRKRKISPRALFVEPERHTTLKTRIFAGHQQVVRVDWEHTHALSQKMNAKISDFIARAVTRYDALIIEDYGKGVINRDLLDRLIDSAHAHKKIITVDPKQEHFHYYRGVTAITPNRRELENAVRNLKLKDTTNSFQADNDALFTDAEIKRAARSVAAYLDLESLLITLGEEGMRLFERSGRSTHIPTVAQEVFDVSGAGDTVISAYTLGLCAGATKLEAAHLANYAAGIVVGKVGTAVTGARELSKRITKTA
ncbi:MAG: D-glycero-beta-D-manno-heptose-7-phosphate kinase [Candidatus Omnitrophica bacterium]|nr:D-glycero-beta-D-manno-heptose-7-phosphate kinase [Candidatus Omnitrophota bacterium]